MNRTPLDRRRRGPPRGPASICWTPLPSRSAEVGWGRVTTRSVAERAGLPHGAVSYHFSGKQELLSEAAVLVFKQAFPIAELEALASLQEALAVMERWMGEAESGDLLVAEVGVEAIKESASDPNLRGRVDALLRSYRAVLAELARRDAAAGRSLRRRLAAGRRDAGGRRR